MTNDEIKDFALQYGFNLKEQPDGTMDLNPYVYEFARALLARGAGLTLDAAVVIANAKDKDRHLAEQILEEAWEAHLKMADVLRRGRYPAA